MLFSNLELRVTFIWKCQLHNNLGETKKMVLGVYPILLPTFYQVTRISGVGKEKCQEVYMY